MSVRVRFAPSPTGQVHIGNIRTAIFNWLFARHEGGEFLLRIEDTDRDRSTPEAVQAVLDAMTWLGLDIDEEPLYQSSRLEAHLRAAEELVNRGLAYKEDKGGTGQGECIIFRMPRENIAFHDEIKGDLQKSAEDMNDLVIVRSNGTPVFHLANVVDDIHMGITHIIRGDDHIENSYRHVALFRALGAETPRYAHLPMIVNERGKPYSKRDGDAFVGDFRAKGFNPECVLNYLSLLGWSPGGDLEKMSRARMIELFTLDRVKSSAAQMDIKKFTHLNGQYIADLSPEDFAQHAYNAIAGEEWARHIDMGYFSRVCKLLQSRTTLYSQAIGWKYFFDDDIQYDEKPVRKALKKDGVGDAINALNASLQTVEFTEEEIERVIREVEAAQGIAEGKLNQPVRVAVTGSGRGAGIYETVSLLGKDRIVKRLTYAAENLC